MLVQSSGIVDVALFRCSLKAKPLFIEHSEMIYILYIINMIIYIYIHIYIYIYIQLLIVLKGNILPNKFPRNLPIHLTKMKNNNM